MRRFLLLLAIAIGLVVAVIAVRTVRFRSRQVPAGKAEPLAFDEAAAAERLAAAIRIRTITTDASEQPNPGQPEALREMHRFLEQSYPRVHSTLHREVVGGGSLLYTWPGSDPSLTPVLLMAHLDVVPVEPGTESRWTQPPFEGRIADGFVWGRGTLDDKGSVLGILEAAEALLSAGWRPTRTIYFAFGHDEEGAGEGARQIVALLKSRGLRLEWVLDEGGRITEGRMPGITAPVAVIGIAEKRYLTIELVARGDGGHAAMPPQENTVAVLARAITRIEAHPFPSHLDGSGGILFEYLGPELPLSRRLVFANLWLFRPLVEGQLSASPSLNAIIRTTVAPTMLDGGVKDNVLPTTARAVVNLRLSPEDSVSGVLEHLRRAIDDPHVELRPRGRLPEETAPTSPVDAPAYAALARTIRQVYPDALVAPFLLVGTTDAHAYTALSPNVYRFTPAWFGPGDDSRTHGIDERLSVKQHADAVRFFAQVMRNASGSSAPVVASSPSP